MSERFLKNPNLPENKVTAVFSDCDDMTFKTLFDKLSIKVVSVAENKLLDTPVSKHADILANYIGKSVFLVYKNQIELCKFIDNNGGKSVIVC